MRKYLVAIGLTAIASLGSAAATQASIPGPDGAFNGCLATDSLVRILDSASACPSGSQSVKWSAGFRHLGKFDPSRTYNVGDVVFDEAKGYWCATRDPANKPPGSYVKVKNVTDPWNQGSTDISPCVNSGASTSSWALVAPQGPKGDKGDVGPREVHHAHLKADSTLIAKSDTDAYTGTWGVGRYYAGFPQADLAKCSVNVTPVLPTSASPPVYADVVYPGYGYVLAEVRTIRPGSWPIAYDYVNAEIYITVSC